MMEVVGEEGRSSSCIDEKRGRGIFQFQLVSNEEGSWASLIHGSRYSA